MKDLRLGDEGFVDAGRRGLGGSGLRDLKIF